MKYAYPIATVSLLLAPALTQAQGLSCFLPPEPYEFKIDKKVDPEFYEFTRDEFQNYLENLEAYLRCLEQERALRLNELSTKYKQFKKNFGKDAVFRYKPQ